MADWVLDKIAGGVNSVVGLFDKYENLWYIQKVSGDEWGIHAVGGDKDFSRRTLDINFPFLGDPLDGQLFINNGELFFVKNKNVGTYDRVEVHAISRSSNYRTPTIQVPTWIQMSDQHHGVFTMYNRALYWVKGVNTASGKIEVFRSDPGDNYGSAVVHKESPFVYADLERGTFSVCREDSVAGYGKEDKLVLVKTKDLPDGKVEVHKWGMGEGTGFGKYTHFVTGFSADEAQNGYFKHSIAGIPGLYFIKTRNCGSGKVEVHFMRAEEDYGNGPKTGHMVTPLDASDIISGSTIALDVGN